MDIYYLVFLPMLTIACIPTRPSEPGIPLDECNDTTGIKCNVQPPTGTDKVKMPCYNNGKAYCKPGTYLADYRDDTSIYWSALKETEVTCNGNKWSGTTSNPFGEQIVCAKCPWTDGPTKPTDNTKTPAMIKHCIAECPASQIIHIKSGTITDYPRGTQKNIVYWSETDQDSNIWADRDAENRGGYTEDIWCEDKPYDS